ncbi:inositol monophosphatase [Aaosphaeria arxii CBS 175.79]|uniref:Inositol-1-monophosphatase n=1 Tax=Aaosphaeria arxii CBS 175.79 TaxID=1450172 RepID=A0A6A5XW29_9PLEO|nr:inositol monophosphatase [Aaosphaeria arxii CBS 175.79]KAF2016911.1 inositol monophosphatase [Aaosphaeria arxii CBS 175.79]
MAEEISLRDVSDFLIGLVKEAADIILDARPTTNTATSKKNTADIVTETDQAVEKFVQEALSRKYPTFAFVGEESYKSGVRITDQPTFIVDPIDGTSNFVHGFPASCISIGLVINRRPVVGVVYNPFQEELWSAVQGEGAFTQRANHPRQQLPLNNTPLQGLGPACIGIEWGSDREGPNFELNLKVFTTLSRTAATGGRFVNSLRCTGSAAITICRVAAGQQEAFWECGCWAWDVAAAWCILAEAGGLMVDGHPGNWRPPIDNRRYLAVRPAVSGQETFVEEFWSVIGNDRSTYGPPS